MRVLYAVERALCPSFPFDVVVKEEESYTTAWHLERALYCFRGSRSTGAHAEGEKRRWRDKDPSRKSNFESASNIRPSRWPPSV